MRYSTVFKFIAVILCAATLLGAVGSAAGILFLTELGGKSVQEHYVDQLRSQSIGYAMNAAGVFASEELGGAPRNLISQYWGNDWENNFFDWTRVGYTLYDSEGNVLQEYEMLDSRDIVFKETIVVGGRYMKVISTTPHEEYFPQETQPAATQGTQVTVMPEQGRLAVHSVYVDYTDGHREEWPYDGTKLGTLEYLGGSEVIFYSNIGELPMGDGWYSNHILFADSVGNIVYEAFDDSLVLLGSSVDNGLIEWYLPAGTVTTAAPVGMTFTSGEYTSYDAIPTQGVTVTQMQVTYGDGSGQDFGSEGISSPELIGTVFHDHQGNAEFHSTEPMTMDIPEDAVITCISFVDAQNNLIYEARCPGGVGSLTNDENGYLVFKGVMPGTQVPEETTPAAEINTETGFVNYPQQEVTVRVQTSLYSAPSAEEVLGTLEPGTVVTVMQQAQFGDGELWALTQQGWIRMADVTSAAADEDTGTVTEDCTAFTQAKIDIYDIPYTSGRIVGSLEPWQEIIIQHQQTFSGGSKRWGQISQGWIPMDNVVLVGETPSQEQNAVTANNDLNVYSTPAVETVVGSIKQGEKISILKQETVDGRPWGLTDAGWILMDQISAAAEPAAAQAEERDMPAAAKQMPAATEIPDMTQAATEVPDVTEVLAEPVAAAEEDPLPTEPASYPEEDVEIGIYHDGEQRMVAEYVMEAIPEGYTMEIRLAHGALRNEFGWTLLRVAEAFRSILLEVLGVCIAVFVLCVVHLCCSAGRTRRNDEVRAGGLNRIPLDLYLVGGGSAIIGLVALAVYGSQYFARNDEQLAIICCGACAYLASLLVVGFFFAFVAQIKTPGGYWWRNSFCGWTIRLMILGCTAMADLGIKSWIHGRPLGGKFFRWLGRTGRNLWLMTKKTFLWLWDTGKRLCIWLGVMVGKCFAWSTSRLARFFGMLPITWQFLATGFVLVFLLYAMMRTYKVGYILLGFGIFFAVILYAASAFAILLENAKKMSKGDLDTKVDDRMLIGGFKDFAGRLNDLAGVAVIAAQKQLKSERMKTELITNVSHDIKTPLTSIINYVDLLQKPHTPQQQEQYLEVLDRQSQRLKKLIDDLMEMSKASTGNMAVDIECMDAGEAVNQALGEFADKLEKAQLTPVFRQPEDQVYMMADGRLVWRVMSNLLGNAVKYALPGTRIYLDLLEMDGKVIISMKNISREELNVNADELMERFVRGDASRNTEGSGLGLNIAQSLMELQKGQLQILVDGDLFKVTMIFPAA